MSSGSPLTAVEVPVFHGMGSDSECWTLALPPATYDFFAFTLEAEVHHYLCAACVPTHANRVKPRRIVVH